MGKKRPFALEKRAQITIFMILGVLLLVIFLFLMQVASQAQKSQFLTEQEKVFSKAFKKESLRLYVDDCLRDELEKGLILLGKQGTIWADQPGGIKQFSEGLNGLTYSTTEEVGEFHSGRIAYAITDEHYLQFPGAYPCDSESGPPSFCQYRHPNISVGFGAVTLLPRTFTSDLKQYLLDRTAWCVQNYVLTDISRHAEIVSTDIELDLTIDEEGIGVKINYPLKFNVGGEEIFSLSTFDFFYPSKFKQLLTVATFALDQDQKLVDFNHILETFTQPIFTYSSEKNVGPCTFDEVAGYFRCERAFPLDTYQSLGITMTPESLSNGDDIFTFTPALYEIVDNPEPYSLRIARQNRPPALDYIQRAACPAEGYDYLVIKRDERYGYGDINIIPHAIDADEDRFTFSFGEELGPAPNDILYRDAHDVESIANGIHTVTVVATDDHGKTDSQEVRVLVDRPIAVELELKFPESYHIPSLIGGGGDSGLTPRYVVSREDPILLHATIPGGTETSNLQTIELMYFNGDQESPITGLGRLEYNNLGILTEQCYNLPLQREGEESTCYPGQDYYLNLYYTADNNAERIRKLTDLSYYSFHPFQRLTDPAAPGTLSLNFNTQYCGVPMDEQRSIINVQVAECAPVRNPEHPYAFPYEKYKFGTITDGEGNIITDFGNFISDSALINPLEATHSCCVGDPDPDRSNGWKRKTAEEGDCFTNPQEGCYGQVLELTTGNNKGYILEQQFATCDGTRGNICGTKQGRLYQEKLRCGTPIENPDCSSDIDSACRGELAFGLVETENGDKGWCHGKMGCADFCDTALVYTLGDTSYVAVDDINRIAQDRQITKNQDMADAGFKCGCINADNGKRCDLGFDGRFTGVCENGQCNDVICTAGQIRCEPDTIRTVQRCNAAGTAWEDTGTCEADEYCSEGICKLQTCTPKDLVCYDGFLDWVGINYPDQVEAIEGAVAANPAFENYPFVCAEDGSEYNLIRAECSPCSDTVTVVEVSVGESEDEEGWRCGGCRPTDADLDRRCLKDRVEGVCKEDRRARTFYCG